VSAGDGDPADAAGQRADERDDVVVIAAVVDAGAPRWIRKARVREGGEEDGRGENDGEEH